VPGALFATTGPFAQRIADEHNRNNFQHPELGHSAPRRLVIRSTSLVRDRVHRIIVRVIAKIRVARGPR